MSSTCSMRIPVYFQRGSTTMVEEDLHKFFKKPVKAYLETTRESWMDNKWLAMVIKLGQSWIHNFWRQGKNSIILVVAGDNDDTSYHSFNFNIQRIVSFLNTGNTTTAGCLCSHSSSSTTTNNLLIKSIEFRTNALPIIQFIHFNDFKVRKVSEYWDYFSSLKELSSKCLRICCLFPAHVQGEYQYISNADLPLWSKRVYTPF